MNARIGAAIAGCAFIAFAGCSGAPQPNLTPANGQLLAPSPPALGRYRHVRTHSAETVIYSFKANGADGKYPVAGLTNVNGTLYGTTDNGGVGGCFDGCGTVFKVTTGGKEQVVYSFAGGSDGAFPQAALTNVHGTLYGTTLGGGGTGCEDSLGCGTVFSITTAGAERVLYRFAGYPTDGAYPEASLTNVNDTLYGTTWQGGTYGCNKYVSGCGVIFKILPSGKYTLLHNFGDTGDGAFPAAALINADGVLYGTTGGGGVNGCEGTGCGTVFSITTAGTEIVLYKFAGGKDGWYPEAPLVNAHGTLYGTTSSGGTIGWGTVFSITTAGTESVLYSFAGYPTDGARPTAGLTDIDGVLYGTTSLGGGTPCGQFSEGCGTAFSITTSGTESVLYSFAGGSDGLSPEGALTKVHGTLYGTTSHGGARNRGTVYSLSGF